MDALTNKQAEVLAFLRKFQAENQMPPTRKEIAKHFGFAPNAAQDVINALAKKGAITVKAKTSRGIFLL